VTRVWAPKGIGPRCLPELQKNFRCSAKTGKARSSYCGTGHGGNSIRFINAFGWRCG